MQIVPDGGQGHVDDRSVDEIEERDGAHEEQGELAAACRENGHLGMGCGHRWWLLREKLVV